MKFLDKEREANLDAHLTCQARRYAGESDDTGSIAPYRSGILGAKYSCLYAEVFPHDGPSLALDAERADEDARRLARALQDDDALAATIDPAVEELLDVVLDTVAKLRRRIEAIKRDPDVENPPE